MTKNAWKILVEVISKGQAFGKASNTDMFTVSLALEELGYEYSEIDWRRTADGIGIMTLDIGNAARMAGNQKWANPQRYSATERKAS